MAATNFFRKVSVERPSVRANVSKLAEECVISSSNAHARSIQGGVPGLLPDGAWMERMSVSKLCNAQTRRRVANLPVAPPTSRQASKREDQKGTG